MELWLKSRTSCRFISNLKSIYIYILKQLTHKIHFADSPQVRQVSELQEHLTQAGDVDACQDRLETERQTEAGCEWAIGHLSLTHIRLKMHTYMYKHTLGRKWNNGPISSRTIRTTRLVKRPESCRNQHRHTLSTMGLWWRVQLL